MATQELKIGADTREPGKSGCRDLRSRRYVPAVVYGPKTKPLTLFIHENDAVKYSRTGFENSIFTIESSNKDLNGLKVLRKSMDIHPVSRRPVHMDFFAPDMTKAVRVNVEVRLVGKARGIADGGLVSLVHREVEIECLPLEIPSHFELDVSDLGLNDSMHVSDIKFPENIKVITGMDETVATCAEVKEEVIAAPVAADAAAAAGAAGTAGAPAAAGAAPGGAGAPGAAGAAAPAAGADKAKK